MALSTNVSIDFKALEGGASVLKTDPTTNSRTDVQDFVSGTVTIAASGSHTVTLNATPLTVIRMIYVQTNGAATLSLLDNDAAANELTTFKIAGKDGNTAAKFFAETAGFTIAASDTFVITNPDSTNAIRCTFFLGGDT